MKHVFRSGLDSLTQSSTLQEAIKVRQLNLIRLKNGEQNSRKQKLRQSDTSTLKQPHFRPPAPTTGVQPKRSVSTYFQKFLTL